MRFHHEARRIAAAPALALVLAASAAACSSSPGTGTVQPAATSPAAAPSAAASSSAPAGGTGIAAGSGMTSAITGNWVKFFKGSTPDSARESLLQNGPAFAKTISGMSAMGKAAAVKVSSVHLLSPKQAAVTYTVYLGNVAALPNAKGIAVLENGTWKVSDASFCQLLTLENGGKTPSVCSSAS
jgi:hypothetical protein